MTFIYCFIVYFCRDRDIFNVKSDKIKTVSASFILAGLYLNIEHLVYWLRWDIDHFGHEQLGLFLIFLAFAIQLYFVYQNRSKGLGALKYINPFYSKDFLAIRYYKIDEILDWKKEKIREESIRKGLPVKDTERLLLNIQKEIDKTPIESNQNLRLTTQILKQMPKSVDLKGDYKQHKFIKEVKSKL